MNTEKPLPVGCTAEHLFYLDKDDIRSVIRLGGHVQTAAGRMHVSYEDALKGGHKGIVVPHAYLQIITESSVYCALKLNAAPVICSSSVTCLTPVHAGERVRVRVTHVSARQKQHGLLVEIYDEAKRLVLRGNIELTVA